MARYAGPMTDPGPLHIDRLRRALRTRRVGRRVIYRPAVASTNDDAWAHLQHTGEDGVVVLAEHQSAGRGRFGRAWHAPRGASLLVSVGFIDDAGDMAGGLLGLVGAVATCDAVRTQTDVTPVIEWPNDLLVRRGKLAGVLVESRRRRDGVACYVLGIGINCLQHAGHFPSELADRATSLDIESHDAVNRTALAVALLHALDDWLQAPRTWADGRLHDAWRARSPTVGGRVHLEHDGRRYSGHVIDLDPTAALVVQLDTGGVKLFRAADTTRVRDQEPAPRDTDAPTPRDTDAPVPPDTDAPVPPDTGAPTRLRVCD